MGSRDQPMVVVSEDDEDLEAGYAYLPRKRAKVDIDQVKKEGKPAGGRQEKDAITDDLRRLDDEVCLYSYDLPLDGKCSS